MRSKLNDPRDTEAQLSASLLVLARACGILGDQEAAEPARGGDVGYTTIKHAERYQSAKMLALRIGCVQPMRACWLLAAGWLLAC